MIVSFQNHSLPIFYNQPVWSLRPEQAVLVQVRRVKTKQKYPLKSRPWSLEDLVETSIRDFLCICIGHLLSKMFYIAPLLPFSFLKVSAPL